MSLHPATDDVIRLCARVQALAPADEDQGTVEELRLRSAWLSERGLTVVVVGEQKRGKSSLINALVGRPGLLPVDVDVATAAFLSVSHGAKDRVLLIGDIAREVTIDELAEYSSVDPETGLDRHPEIIGLTVEIPADILTAGLTLVDTPGVGGLLAGHADITLGALEHADALLFVLNESMELSSSELEFLRRATRRTRHTLFVLNAIDRNLHWHDTLERNMHLLREHAPEYAQCPWYAVSSRFKTQSDQYAVTDPDFAQDLLRRSRCEALAQALRDDLGRRVQAGRLRAVLDLCAQYLARAERRRTEQDRVLRQDETLGAELAQRREHIADAMRQDARWRSRLGERVEDLRGRLLEAVDERLVSLRTAQLSALAQGGRTMPTQVERDLSDSLRGLKVAFDTELFEGLSALCQDLCADFETAGIQVTPAELRFGTHRLDTPQGTGAPTAPVPAPTPDPEPGTTPGGGGWLQQVLGDGAVGQAVGSAVGGTVPVVFAALGAVATAGATVVAAAAAVFLVRRSTAARRRAEVEARVDTVIERGRDEFPALLATALRHFSQTLATTATETLQERLRDTDAAITEAERQRAAQENALAPLLVEARRQRIAIETLRSETDGLRERVGG
ncbi:dynamin family protein [Streptomyces endophyticus]|uniref:Dynamin family protein n=1 Tax=Streptomyces endophyticus TaxID=714166 RepID=A0ABU6FG01_9ACTN|nr:dynamin family protein [Streptomyces endophyticus]MEB8341727.1 dynamin family protein [Streptomyces endophyticus]